MSNEEDSGAEFLESYVLLFVRASRVARRIVGNAAEAEDIAAETMIRAMSSWRRVHTYRNAWVSRVACNLAIDSLRRRTPEAVAKDFADPTADIADRIYLASALKSLPKRQREALVLKYLVGMTGQEAADVMGVSATTFDTHLQRGLHAMRRRTETEFKERPDGIWTTTQSG